MYKNNPLIKMLSLGCLFLATACQSNLTTTYGYSNLVAEEETSKTLVFVHPERVIIDDHTQKYSEPYKLAITYLVKDNSGEEVKLKVRRLKINSVSLELPQYTFTKITTRSKYQDTEYLSKAQFELKDLYTTHKPIDLSFELYYKDKKYTHELTLEPVYSEKEFNSTLNGMKREFWD